jgi:hypothetical protein
MPIRCHTLVFAALLCALLAGFASAETPVGPVVDALLVEGKLADAERQLDAQLAASPKDDNARFALGIVQTLRGGERLMQSLYRYGLNPQWMTMLPVMRLPVPLNPKPEPLTNEAFRKIIIQLTDDLAQADKTLSAIESSDVKLTLHLGLGRMDFDGDGQATDQEMLWQVFSRITGRHVTEAQAAEFVMALDKGDVHWLRGYCHLLSGLFEMGLAFDTRELHDHAARLFFPTAKVPYDFLHSHKPGYDPEFFVDVIAFVHELRLPLAEPERLAKAREHFLTVIEQSRLSWKAILAETDDDHEWIPSPKQWNPAVPGALVRQEMVDSWMEVLDELEAVLNGKKLVPFWRGAEPRGVNIKRAFLEPRAFDLVLWVQGTAAAQYLEEGEKTTGEFWHRIRRGFQGQFFWFALWVN